MLQSQRLLFCRDESFDVTGYQIKARKKPAEVDQAQLGTTLQSQ
jgi:hypothetical protein